MDSILTALQATIISIMESGLIIILAALIIGVIIKKWVPDTALQNKWIPTVNIIAGAILGVAISACFPDVGKVTQAIYGALCGLSASLIYDKVIAMFGGKE